MRRPESNPHRYRFRFRKQARRLALGGVSEMLTFVIAGGVLLLALLSGILLDDPAQKHANGSLTADFQ